MIDPESCNALKNAISEQMKLDKFLLDDLRSEIRPARGRVKRIQPRQTTAVSLVATDGGNNRIQFDPFLVQLVRVVDSSNKEHCLEAVTPTTDVAALSASQFRPDGSPCTPLGAMMAYLKVSKLTELSQMIRLTKTGEPVSPSWVQVYRELMEWAVLFQIVRTRDFATDTIIIRDGLLRSKVFAKELFVDYRRGLEEGIQHQRKQHRKIYIAGLSKSSKVLSRYRLAMALEGVLTCSYPAYVDVDRELERKAYVWGEYARGADVAEAEGGEAAKYVGGTMFFVKFGPGPRAPVWPVDIFSPQVNEAAAILGYMLSDADNGFPIAHYPMCLQKATENAELVDFDFDILQEQIFESLREALGNDQTVLDTFRFQIMSQPTAITD